MKLAGKLTLALMIAMLAVLIIQATSRLEREAELFQSSMERYHDILGHVVTTAVARTAADHGAEGALRALEDLSNATADISVDWMWLDVGGSSPGERDPARLELLRAGHVVTAIASSEEGGDGYFRSYFPTVLGQRAGAIRLSESLTRRRDYLAATLQRIVLFTATMALLAGLIARGLGVWLVGRPVRRLVDKARRVGAGDLSTPLRLDQRDEIGELAQEMNVMCDRLSEARHQVETEVAQRIAVLSQLRHADRLTTVGTLAAGIAHEVGTPLNVVAMRGKMIATGEVTGEAVVESARSIVEQCDRITRVVRQFLDFARPAATQRAVEDLVPVIRGTLALLAPLAAKRQVEMHFEDPRSPILADVDSGQIQQALTNLVVNGIQAMPAGGELTVAARREELPGRDEADPAPCPLAVITVTDHGVGIPAEHIERLFEPFFTTKPAGEGTGLGLAVTAGIVRDHGGFVDVDSTVGAGSRFSIHLPLRSSET